MSQLSLFEKAEQRATVIAAAAAPPQPIDVKALAVVPAPEEEREPAYASPIASHLERELQRQINVAELDNRRLQGLLDQLDHGLDLLTDEDLRDVFHKVNATGLSLREWIDAADVEDTPRHRRMWAADYDPFEVRHINAGQYPPEYILAEPEPRHVYSPPYPPNTIGAILRPDDKAIDDSWRAELARHKSRGGRVKYQGGSPPATPPKPTPLPAPVPKQARLRTVSRSDAPPSNEPQAAMRTLTERQRELLANMVIEKGRAVYGPDETIPDWPELKSVMEVLGGTYVPGGKGKGNTRRKGAFSFPADVDVEETLWLAKERGEVLDPKLVGTFLTPESVANIAAMKLDWSPGMRIVEPSAGTGNLVRAALRVDPTAIIECVELLEAHRSALKAAGFKVIGKNFLKMHPEEHEPFDAALMNPPFNKGLECHHLLHAARFVRPRGTISSIVSRSVTFRQDSPYSDLARWIKSHGQIEALPDGAFKDSGTNIRTALLWARVCDGCKTGACWKQGRL